jgi:hypothetical protein
LFDLRLLFSVWYLQTFGHCVVYPCLIYDFCLALNGQKFEDSKELNRSRKSNKDRQHNDQKFEDTKELKKSHKSNKDKQHIGQKFEDSKELNRSRKSNKDRQHKIYDFCFLFGIFKLLVIVLSILV